MNIPYQLTLNEYQEAVNYHYKTGKRPIFVSLFIGLATFMILVGTDFSSTRDVMTKMFMVFFTISFYILFTRMITAYQAKKIYNKNPILSNEVILHISGKGIQLDKKSHSKTLPWNLFIKWKKNEKYYILYTSSHQFNIIPIRAMNETQIKELEDFLEKYLKRDSK